MKNLELQKILSNFPDDSEVNFLTSYGFEFDVNSVQIENIGTITLSNFNGWV